MDSEVRPEEDGQPIEPTGVSRLPSHLSTDNAPPDDTATTDPLRTVSMPVPYVCEGDHVLLIFADGKQVFAHCVRSARGKTPPVKIGKRTYSTANLIGLHFGTVLELGPSGLTPLPEGERLLPDFPSTQKSDTAASNGGDTSMPKVAARDNRNLVDTNTSQALGFHELQHLRDSGTNGSVIVEKIIENSSTFDQKTDFSRAKYVARKQMKYQPRCRIVRCTGSSICNALYVKDPKRVMNLREDTLGQILSHANVYAGCQALVFESTLGIVTGSVAQRMGGYGKILSIYSGQQPSWTDYLQKFNLSFAENQSIKWLHASDVFADDASEETRDPEKEDRDIMEWPCPLQDHTRAYMREMKTEAEQENFLARRAARFTRKLTRHTPMEAKEWLVTRQSDAVIIAVRYDPTSTLMKLLPFLAPSCPFVVFSEFIEPLTACFLDLQRRALAINLRLSDTWAREYQILPGRTHPVMDMSQSGGFVLTGVKLDPEAGRNELDEDLLKEIRAEIGGRRGKKPKSKRDLPKNGTWVEAPTTDRAAKRPRTLKDSSTGSLGQR